MNQNKVLSVRNLVLIAMFSALAAVLETIQVAVPFAPPFYKLDFAELPVLIGGFAMGPAQAALIAIVKNLLKLLLNGTSTYYVGELGNIIGSCMFSVPAALIYRRHKTKKTAMVALAAGVICAIVGAVFVNCAITSVLRKSCFRRNREHHRNGNKDQPGSYKPVYIRDLHDRSVQPCKMRTECDRNSTCI